MRRRAPRQGRVKTRGRGEFVEEPCSTGCGAPNVARGPATGGTEAIDADVEAEAEVPLTLRRRAPLRQRAVAAQGHRSVEEECWEIRPSLLRLGPAGRGWVSLICVSLGALLTVCLKAGTP